MKTAITYFFTLSLLLIALCPAEAQPASEAAPDSNSLSTEELHYEGLYTSLYAGRFVNVPFDRDDVKFAAVYSTYLNSYAQACDVLPADKVEITTQECATERVTRNGWGVETSRYCVRWVTLGTGLYAKPDLIPCQAGTGSLAEQRRVAQLVQNDE